MFKKIADINELAQLKKEWLESLTSPQDDFWEHLRSNGIHWGITYLDKLIGYACVNRRNQLLQFYISPEYLPVGETIFKKFLELQNIEKGIVGTNNPIYLSLALHLVKELEINTYLFRKYHDVLIEKKEGNFKQCEIGDIDRLVDFQHYSTEADKDWATEYLGNLIEKKEVFILEQDAEIIGLCEVRKRTTAPAYADIGMVVSPDYRRKGYGTYLLNRAKEIAIERKKKPICSCDKNNIGSFKSITNCGFVSTHQLVEIVFKK